MNLSVQLSYLLVLYPSQCLTVSCINLLFPVRITTATFTRTTTATATRTTTAPTSATRSPYSPYPACVSSEKVILCTRDTTATYKLSDISLEYDAIFDELYATTIGELYAGTTSIPYTKVTSIHYQTLSKKDTTWKIDVNNLSVRSLQGLLLLFLDKRDDFANKNEKFYNPSIKKIF